MEFLIWLERTPLSDWVRTWPWANPILLCMHAIGMALVVGSGLMTGARVLGFARSLPLSLFAKLTAVAWIGVAINATSGVLLFIADGEKYVANWTFLLKISLIAAAGVATWAMWRELTREDSASTGMSFGAGARVAAFASIVLWIGAVTAGRMIAYTLTAG